MVENRLIGVGTLLHSATLGVVAIAATLRDGALVLVDARVVHTTAHARWLIGTLRNASGAGLTSRIVNVVLLDRRGTRIASLRHRLPALPIDGCCALRSRRLAAETARFRIELVDAARADAVAVQQR